MEIIVGLSWLATYCMLILKIFGVIHWSWLIVFFPVYFPFFILIIISSKWVIRTFISKSYEDEDE